MCTFDVQFSEWVFIVIVKGQSAVAVLEFLLQLVEKRNLVFNEFCQRKLPIVKFWRFLEHTSSNLNVIFFFFFFLEREGGNFLKFQAFSILAILSSGRQKLNLVNYPSSWKRPLIVCF